MIRQVLRFLFDNQRALHYYNLIRYFHKNTRADIRRAKAKGSPITQLDRFEQHFYSQNGEDGIIRCIFDKINVTNRYCVEFGIHPDQGNTIYLSKQNWQTLWMDGNGDGSVIKKEFITAENIVELFKKYGVPPEFDLLSIDIDSNDYWVWKAITEYSPRVVVMEYNSSIPAHESKTIAYDPTATWNGTDYFGASLLALTNLGISKGYTLIGCDSLGVNAFFVRNDLVGNHFTKQSVEALFKPPRFGPKVNGHHTGHPPDKRKMVDV